MTMLDDQVPSLEIVGAVARITFRRPREHNRIDPDDIAVIDAHLAAVEANADVRVLLFTGTGDKTFSSGYTIDAIVERLDRGFEDMLDRIERFPLPTLCVLNGSVYGGATDLALCCDFRIGLRGIRMLMPASRFGLHYYPGGLRRYVTQLGSVETKRLFLTGRPIDADAMLRVGFLTDLVDAADLDACVETYLGDIAACVPSTLRSVKRQINAIAAGEPGAATSRDDHERSLASDELKERLRARARS